MKLLTIKKSNNLEIYCRADHLLEIAVHKNIINGNQTVIFEFYESRKIEIPVELNYPEYKVNLDIDIILSLINRENWNVINLNEYFKGGNQNEEDQESELIHY